MNMDFFHKNCLYPGPCPLNLGLHILPSKWAPDTPHLGCQWTALAENLVGFWPRVWSKVHKMSAKSLPRRLRTWQSTEPKFKGWGLFIPQRLPHKSLSTYNEISQGKHNLGAMTNAQHEVTDTLAYTKTLAVVAIVCRLTTINRVKTNVMRPVMVTPAKYVADHGKMVIIGWIYMKLM